MSHADRILMGPGPGNPYPEVIEAFGRPVLGHLDPEFIALLDEINDRLRKIFCTENLLTFPVSATGSAGMEASFVNVLGPGDVVVVGVNGVFGERMCDVASRCGAEVVRLETEWGTAIEPQALLDAHPSPKVIALVHAETSTGVRNDIEPIGAGKGDALLLVDCVTSLGGIPLEVDEWDIDLAYSGTQKCLGVPPGLSPVTVSDRAIEGFVEKSQSWYLDFSMIANYVTGDGARAYHHTAPISMLYALHAGLGVLLDEGLENVHARHRACGERLQEGLVKRGFELFADEDHRLPELTSVVIPTDRLPAGLDEAGVRHRLLSEYGIEIGGGLGPVAGKVWRIGCMGHTARERNVTMLLGALDEILG
ncbi:MAG: alanine--glyoxylate aminotransferase [Acidimicrobiaceae bacterium]|nr:alanine--glyoxylate aminotransferase [Acidimicrobiaceae bacterium]